MPLQAATFTITYRQRGAGMGRLGLQDPELLWDAYSALQNFIPVIEALVMGNGDRVVVTQEMVADALDIWQRLAYSGSPELASVISAELVKYTVALSIANYIYWGFII